MNEQIKHVSIDENGKVLCACYTDNIGTNSGFYEVFSQESRPTNVPEDMVPFAYFDTETAHIYYKLEPVPIEAENAVGE